MRLLYQRAKSQINHWCDVVIGLCRFVLMDIYGSRWDSAQSVLRAVARAVGNLCWQIQAFPRMPAYQVSGGGWTIVFLGTDQSLREVCHLFVKDDASPRLIGRVPLWRVRRQTHRWLCDGVSLVIYEHVLVGPWHPTAPISFRISTWVNQQVSLSGTLESMLTGKHFQNVRHHLNKARNAGFTSRYSNTLEDYERFYNDLYIPFVTKRHGDLSLASSFAAQKRLWFDKGGLILVQQGEKTVAGSLCRLVRDTCYGGEEGILVDDPTLLKNGINSFLVSCVLNWAREQGARHLNMGGSHGWRSSGPFRYKSDWGSTVVLARRIYSKWTILADQLTEVQLNELNRIAFITELNRYCLTIILAAEDTSLDSTSLESALREAYDDGLDGIAVVSRNAKTPQIILGLRTPARFQA